MKRINYLVLVVSIAILLPSISVFCQGVEKTPVLNKGSIESQFQEIMDKSSNYQDFKLVKVSVLNSLKTNITDSITKSKSLVAKANSSVISGQLALDSLKNQLNVTKAELVNVHSTSDSIHFLFFDANKNVYNKIVWGLIGALVLALAVFVLLYKKTKGTVDQAKADLEEKKQELESFRKRALERESQISRNYLNELNKYRNNSQLEFKN